MAAPSKPKPRAAKGTPPSLEQTGAGIETTGKDGRESSGGSQILIRTDPEIKREFNTYAAANDIKLNSLFKKMFEFYKAHH